MNDQLRIALSTVGKTVEGLDGEFWYLEASQDEGKPYAVFSEFASRRENDSVDKFDFSYIQVNVYSSDIKQLEDLGEKIEEKFDGKKESFQMMVSLWMIDINLITPGKVTHVKDGLYKISQEYRIHLQHK